MNLQREREREREKEQKEQKDKELKEQKHKAEKSKKKALLEQQHLGLTRKVSDCKCILVLLVICMNYVTSHMRSKSVCVRYPTAQFVL
jgi:hypothetical protein